MGIFPGFGGWISQNTHQPKQSENVESKPMRETKTHGERDETKEQLKLWREANKKEKYKEPPPKVKVRHDYSMDGFSNMKMEFTLGLPPQAAYDLLTKPDNITYSRAIKGRPLLKTISRKVTPKKLGGEELPTGDVEKEFSWNFLFFSRTIPIPLSVLEDPKKLSVYYDKGNKGLKSMEGFEGRYKVEPIFVDAERLCKHMKPKSIEEYRKCSGGKGLIASKVKMRQTFRPSFPWDLPLLSWCIRRFTVENTKKVAVDLQKQAGQIRDF